MQSMNASYELTETTPCSQSDRRTEIEEIETQMLEMVGRLKQLSINWPGNLHLEESILYQQRALASLSTVAETPDDMDQFGQVDWKAFGLRLLQHREAAKMQQKELAGLLNVSALTVRNIESAAKRPGRDLLFRLLAIPELNLTISDLTGDENKPRLIPTSWLAPQYDPHKMLTDLVARLNGMGDALEQTTAYLDSRSAADWLSFSLSPDRLALFSHTAALESAAKIVMADVGRGAIEICSLGSGDARKETMFTRLCADQISNSAQIRLYLLDISHTLLTEGYNHARQSLVKHKINVMAMHGNFHDLARYPLLEKQTKKKNEVRIITMLGNTLANLDNEVRFFRDTLSSCMPGDYFLADFTIAHAPADNKEEIERNDPALLAPVPNVIVNWLGGPLRRYCKELRDVEFSVEVDTQCPVRGSYELLYVAKVAMIGGKPERRFVMFRCKLYDPAKLTECLKGHGWKCESLTPYVSTGRTKSMLMLLRKQ